MATLSVVVPTRDEAGNVPALLDRLDPVLVGMDAEVIFVDDSDDTTPAVVAAEASARASSLTVVLHHRPPGERTGGLGGAVLAGFRVATGDWVVVMDGDLQHPPELVPVLPEVGETVGVDVVVASRYRGAGDAAGLSGRRRRFASTATGRVAQLLFPRALRDVSDPMSGFFAVRRAALDLPALRPDGFKVLLEVLIRSHLSVTEVPFTFATRHAGDSKASLREGLRFLRHLLRLRLLSSGAR